MTIKASTTGALLKIFAAVAAVGVVGGVGATAVAALTEQQRTEASQAAEAVRTALSGLMQSTPSPSQQQFADTISGALSGFDPQVANAGLAEAATFIESLALDNPALAEAYAAVQQDVLAAAVVAAVLALGANPSEEAVATAIADTVSVAGVSAATAQAALAEARAQLPNSEAINAALDNVGAAVNTAQINGNLAQVQIGSTNTVINVYIRG